MARILTASCLVYVILGVGITDGDSMLAPSASSQHHQLPDTQSGSGNNSINSDSTSVINSRNNSGSSSSRSGISSSAYHKPEEAVLSFISPLGISKGDETPLNISQKTPEDLVNSREIVRRNTATSSSSSSSSSGRSSSRSSSSITITVGSRPMGMNLSGSSSTPVEPIKPLLELGVGEEGAPLIVPPHPVFDEAAPRNVSALAGNAAYLHCLVHNLANKSVSWIRQRDLHILTVGRYTYTTDQRYEVIHSSGSKDWILKIKYAQVRDSGNYECQVSTKPVRTYVVKLNIFAPHAEIIGSPDMHVDKGSTINLTCIIAHSPEPPNFIFWYHNGKVISYDSPRGGITSVTERSNATTGYLLIQDAKASDSGNYSCAPSNTNPTMLRVHVLNGETPEAVQTNRGVGLLTSPTLQLLLFLLPCLCSSLLMDPLRLFTTQVVVVGPRRRTKAFLFGRGGGGGGEGGGGT